MARKPRPGSIRNVVTGRSDGYTGRVPFPRLGETVAYESMLAGDFLVVSSAFDSGIVTIRSEPMKLSVRLAGTTSLYTPDYLIERTAGPPQLVEVKPLKVVEPNHPDHAERDRLCAEADARFEALQEACVRAGFEFGLFTEAEIRVEPRLFNAAQMLRHSDDFYPKAALLAGREALLRACPRTIEELQAALPDIDALPLAVRLAWIGDLEIEPGARFSRASKITTRLGRVVAPAHAT